MTSNDAVIYIVYVICVINPRDRGGSGRDRWTGRAVVGQLGPGHARYLSGRPRRRCTCKCRCSHYTSYSACRQRSKDAEDRSAWRHVRQVGRRQCSACLHRHSYAGADCQPSIDRLRVVVSACCSPSTSS